MKSDTFLMQKAIPISRDKNAFAGLSKRKEKTEAGLECS
jgi:hypothetical protein